MKRILLLAVVTVLSLSTTMAQTRYLDEVFTNITVTSNVQYGQNYSVLTGSPILQNLVMDVYEPANDTTTARPLIVMTPTGSFLPKYINQLPTGSKTDSATVEICMRLAKQGYVVACIDYRTGWNPQGTQDERTETIIQAVYRAMQDTKTAVRFFRMDEATQGNTYGIDPARVVVGGQGSGGYIAFAYATVNKLTELQLTKFFNFTTNAFMVDTAILGDWDGYGGNPALNQVNHPGYSSDVSMVFNIGGAMGDSTWLEPGEVPMVSFHGVADAFAPYTYGIVTVPGTSLFVVDVSGSSDVIRIANQFGNNDVFFTPPINDAWTTVANTNNTNLDGLYGNGGNEGLNPFIGIADGNGPWEWWDDAAVTAGATALGQDPATVLANGYASNPVYQALGPVAGRARAVAFIDTIQGYLSPRLYRVLFEVGVGVDEATDLSDEVNVYPNPTSSVINIAAKGNRTLQAVRIYSTTGQLVREVANIKAAQYQINDADLPTGLYMLNIQFAEGIATKKLVIK